MYRRCTFQGRVSPEHQQPLVSLIKRRGLCFLFKPQPLKLSSKYDYVAGMKDINSLTRFELCGELEWHSFRRRRQFALFKVLFLRVNTMEYCDEGAYERMSKSIAESRRGTWMPARRRNRIKRKVLASCLVTLLGICCCTYCTFEPADEPQEFDDDTVVAKENFVNLSL